jgi:hypothetical protein
VHWRTGAFLLGLGVAALTAASAGATPAPFAQVSVSQVRGLQAEVAVAADPENDQILLAGSNSVGDGTSSFSRVYTSTDGGATWRSEAGPPALQASGARRCSFGDPTVAIGRAGREYFGFLTAPCRLQAGLTGGKGLDPDAEPADRLGPDAARVSVEVATRVGPAGAWRTAAVFPVRSVRFDDKPALAVDLSPESPHLDRVYVAWSKSVLTGSRGRQRPRTDIAVASSDDGGAAWSKPVVASGGVREEPPVFASLALDRAGTLFLGWTDNRQQVWLDRSTDGGLTFGRDVLVDSARGLPGPRCDTAGVSVAAQRRRCITPVPTVLLDDRAGSPERVYVTYSAAGADGHEQDIFVAAFDGALAPLLGPRAGERHRVNPPDAAFPSDQFMPAAAVDPASGRLWACYYDTSADRLAQQTVFTCTVSADGGVTWAAPVRAASRLSNMTVAKASFFQYGDYQGLAVVGGVAHPIWTDSRDLATLQEEVYTTVLTDADLGLQPPQ